MLPECDHSGQLGDGAKDRKGKRCRVGRECFCNISIMSGEGCHEVEDMLCPTVASAEQKKKKKKQLKK